MAEQATTQSAVGTDIAKLYETISNFQGEINEIEQRHSQERAELEQKHKAELSEKNNEFNKAKASFASYLKQAGIEGLFATAPTANGKGKGKQADLFGATDAKKERKPRTSSDEVKASLERNKAIYTSTYELGVDEKTGLPKRYKGRSQKNVDIDRMMKQDEEAYAASNAGARTNLTETANELTEQLTKAAAAKGGKKK
jgi:hypothetical protein